MAKNLNNNINMIERPPVVAIMGHIDHGKSTLLDYIRKTNIVDKEAGGITQHVSAYEVVNQSEKGEGKKITFLDTPGHEAFQAIRVRGAHIADIVVLVVSAEDGVKPQTLEALKCIKEEGMPYIVAINKIDRPGADIERTKQSLAENEIYIEGYGGSIPSVPISAKTGEGIPSLLDMILLVAEMEELKGDTAKKAEGIVLESNLDAKKGISATLVIKEGSLKKGMFVTADDSISPIRMMEDFAGKQISEATFSSPIKIIGWNKLPKAGAIFKSFDSKKEAEESAVKFTQIISTECKKTNTNVPCDKPSLPIILKADVSGSMEAIIHETLKIKNDRIDLKTISSGIGTISENDVRLASGDLNTVILGFNVKIDPPAANMAERLGIEIKTFDIIYKLTEWLEQKLKEKAPVLEVEELTGKAKILKIFSKSKDKQIIGGRVEEGNLISGVTIRILRRDAEIGQGKVRGLQIQKEKATEVKEGLEFGSMIESKTEIAPGDKIESFKIVKKLQE